MEPVVLRFDHVKFRMQPKESFSGIRRDMAEPTVEANLFAQWQRALRGQANPYRQSATAVTTVPSGATNPLSYADTRPSAVGPTVRSNSGLPTIQGMSFVAKDGLDRAVAAGDAAAGHLRILLQKVGGVVADLTSNHAVHDSLPFPPAPGEPDSCASMVGRTLYGRATQFELNAFFEHWMQSAADLSRRVTNQPGNFVADVNAHVRQQIQAVRAAAQELQVRRVGQLGKIYQSPLGPRDPGPFNGGRDSIKGASDYTLAFQPS
jgi:hypothetical protein